MPVYVLTSDVREIACCSRRAYICVYICILCVYIYMYTRIYVYIIFSLSPRLRMPRRARLEYSVPTAGDGELVRAALPRGDQSRRRIHRGGFPHRRAISLPRDAALGQSWQARRRADLARATPISPDPFRRRLRSDATARALCCRVVIIVVVVLCYYYRR